VSKRLSVRFNIWILASALLLSVGFLYSLYEAQEKDSQPTYSSTKIIRYGFSVKNTTSDFIESAEFVSFSPYPQTATQKLISIKSNSEYIVKEDSLGNRRLAFKVENLAPYASKSIVITAELALSEQPNRELLGPGERLRNLVDERYIELSSPVVKREAKRFDKEIDKPKSIFEYLNRNVADIGFVSKDRGAAYALKHLKADCTEYMYSFVALNRSQKIPSRSLAGFWLSGNSGLLRASGYHNWAEYYDGNKWVLADPQRGNFDTNYENYIVFRRISDREQEPMENAERFLAYDQRLRVSMN